jgi:FKBP-type peptidyl-prolyl cis-trans isomerase
MKKLFITLFGILLLTACKTMPKELTIDDITLGTGPVAEAGDTVSVHYTGTLEDGTKFDSSKDRGTPFVFTVGRGNVIEGWEKGIPGMQVGGVRKLTIPSDMAYGNQGVPGVIPGGATLLFEVELLEIK